MQYVFLCQVFMVFVICSVFSVVWSVSSLLCLLVVCIAKFHFACLCCMLDPLVNKADYAMHLADWSAQGGSAAVHKTSLLTQHVFFSHTSPVCLCLPLLSCLALTTETWREINMQASDGVCLLSVFLCPPLIFLSFSKSLLSCHSVTPLTSYTKKTKHGEQQCCHSSSGTCSEREV